MTSKPLFGVTTTSIGIISLIISHSSNGQSFKLVLVLQQRQERGLTSGMPESLGYKQISIKISIKDRAKQSGKREERA